MTEDTAQGFSRRNFIKGVVAAGAVASSSAYLFRIDAAARPAVGAGTVERLITLNVNGQDRRVDVMPQETLAMTLRYKLGLTGTKLGCDRAECGACTVLIDDVPHYSCSVLTHRARGKKVVTIEGLADPATGKLSAVQQGVVDEQGFQCAFCMPGFVMAATGYLKTNPNPTRAGARARRLGQSVPLPGLRQDSHGADARRRAACEADTWRNKLIGQNYTTPDLVAKVTGQAKYAEDFRVEGMLFCKLLLSPMPHAPRQAASTRARRWRCRASKASSPPTRCPAPAEIVTDLGAAHPGQHRRARRR